MTTGRPDPDRLLDALKPEQGQPGHGRGQLKIFFGACAGVGKTYAMLAEARARQAEGTEVLVGLVETHGRDETMQMLEGLPLLPRQVIDHRGMTIEEFDLEAALARKPGLLLLDELAHSNAPGSRHPKRWQDVEELLARGIDIYSTLNVQHLESLNDMVTRLTGVSVRETVPDALFDAADDIALIDLPSDALLKRLSQGKIYIAPGAKTRAQENFFKKSNLIALREIALRRTAERVDAQMDRLTASEGRAEVQIGEKILVCLGHDEFSAQVLRHAKRLAARSRAPWIAAYIETARHASLSDEARRRVEHHLRLAERLGGRTVTLKGNHAAEEILSYAASHGVTRILVGSRPKSRLRQWMSGSLASDLLQRASGVEITVITGAAGSAVRTSQWKRLLSARPGQYLKSLGVVALIGASAWPLRGKVDPDNLILFFQIAVLINASRYGLLPSLVASILGIAAYNFLFVPPYYSFTAYDTGYYFTFAAMLASSVIIGSMGSKLSLQARFARAREQETALLYSLTRELSAARGLDAMAEIARRQMGEAFAAEIVLIVPEGLGLRFFPEDSPARELKEESVVRWAMENGQAAGLGTDTMPSARGLYLPLIAEKEQFGVLGVIPPLKQGKTGGFASEQEGRLEAFASLIASAFQRARRAHQAESAKVEAEGQKLRNTLLSSVSHDLRTPLASITGAASTLLMEQGMLSPQAEELVGSIHSQAGRLSRLVSNLLDVTSLESGTLKLNRQPHYLDEIVGAALAVIEVAKGKRTVKVNLDEGLPLLDIDGVLIEQVLINLLENALRYTIECGQLFLHAKREGSAIVVRVGDDGTGIAVGQEDRIFEKFHTADRSRSGSTGLGLAVCRGIVEAHGGRIWAGHRARGGAEFSFTLPVWSRAQPEAEK